MQGNVFDSLSYGLHTLPECLLIVPQIAHTVGLDHRVEIHFQGDVSK